MSTKYFVKNVWFQFYLFLFSENPPEIERGNQVKPDDVEFKPDIPGETDING